MRETLNEVVTLQWTWKTPAMRRMAVAICELALARVESGAAFSANELPESLEHGGRGIAGAIFRTLAKDGILCPVGRLVNGAFMQDTVHNAGGNRIGLWRLRSAARARAFLRVQGGTVHEEIREQVELVF